MLGESRRIEETLLEYLKIDNDGRQYLDDCRLLRRMFRGEPLQPPFLGTPRSPTPA